MSLATSGIVASIVPSGLTGGIAVVATAMLAVFVLAMVAFTVASITSSSWIGQSTATPTSSTAARGAEPSDD